MTTATDPGGELVPQDLDGLWTEETLDESHLPLLDKLMAEFPVGDEEDDEDEDAPEIEAVGVPDLLEFGGWEEIREVTRCTGHCCRSFTLGRSPAELGQMVIRSRRYQAGEGDVEDPGSSPSNTNWIATALVYQGEHSKPPSGFNNLTVSPDSDRVPKEGDSYWYGCRHLVDGSCGVYEDRPDVCRDYPYRGCECRNEGCTRRTVMASGLSWWRKSGVAAVVADIRKAMLDGVDDDVAQGPAQSRPDGVG